MSSVGAYLRGLRQKQGMSIDELSRATRVLHHYLEALETDNIGSLPAPVFTKGFIRAYCQAVGVSPDEALRLYDRIGVPAPDVTKVPVGAVRSASVPGIRRRIVHEPDYLPVTPPGPSPQGEPRDKRARGTLLVSFVLLVVLGVSFFAVTLVLQSGRPEDGEPNARVALPPVPGAADAPAASPVPAAAPAAAPVESPAPQPAEANQLSKQSSGAAPSASASPSAPASSASPTPSARVTASAPATPIAPAAPSVATAPRPPAPSAAVPAQNAATAPTAATAPNPAAAPAPPAAAAVPVIPTLSGRGLGLPYRLVARTTETTWMRVRTEDGRTTEETIPANEIREWISNGPFVITIGNAGGVSLELNGRPIPRLGASGSVITRFVLPSDNQ